MYLAVLLAIHLIAMNLASALSLLCLVAASRNESGEWVISHRMRSAVYHALLALSFGMALGGLMYVLADESLRAAWRRLPERAYWFALSELLFSAGCLLWQARLMRGRRKGKSEIAVLSKAKYLAAIVLALLSSSNLLYHFPPLMTALGKLATNPTWSRLESLPRQQLLSLMTTAEVISLTVHFTFASVAVSAVYLMWLLTQEAGSDAELGCLKLSSVQRLSRIALLVTVAQVGIGVWVLTALDSAARDQLLGADILASLSLAAAILATLILCERLAILSFGEITREASRRVAMLLLIVVVLMSISLYRVRYAKDDSINETRPQQQAVAALASSIGDKRNKGYLH